MPTITSTSRPSFQGLTKLPARTHAQQHPPAPAFGAALNAVDTVRFGNTVQDNNPFTKPNAGFVGSKPRLSLEECEQQNRGARAFLDYLRDNLDKAVFTPFTDCPKDPEREQSDRKWLAERPTNTATWQQKGALKIGDVHLDVERDVTINGRGEVQPQYVTCFITYHKGQPDQRNLYINQVSNSPWHLFRYLGINDHTHGGDVPMVYGSKDQTVGAPPPQEQIDTPDKLEAFTARKEAMYAETWQLKSDFVDFVRDELYPRMTAAE